MIKMKDCLMRLNIKGVVPRQHQYYAYDKNKRLFDAFEYKRCCKGTTPYGFGIIH